MRQLRQILPKIPSSLWLERQSDPLIARPPLDPTLNASSAGNQTAYLVAFHVKHPDPLALVVTSGMTTGTAIHRASYIQLRRHLFQ